ncbi:MAG: TonB-dependent receptor [bacterium]
MKIRIVILVLFVAFNTGFAQSFSISGTVLDSANKMPLLGVSVSISHISKDFKSGALTNNKGYFSIEDLEKGRYNLICSYIGYKPFDTIIQIKNSNVKLAKIYLTEQSTVTDEVEVVGQMPAVELKGDTTQFNADAYKTQPDATAEDLVQKMPGVVLQDNKVQAQGENVKKVLMDGKPFFGDDPTAALKNLPAQIIDKIQIYDEKSEQSQFTGFDDGNTTKTLNIITRTNMRRGQFGKAYAGYGNEEHYQAGTNFNIFGEDSRISILAQSNNVNQQNFAIEDILGAISSSGSARGPFFGGPGMMRSPAGGMRRGGGPRFFGGGSVGDFLVGNQDGITSTNAFGINYSDDWGKSIKVSGSYFFNYGNNEAINNTFREYISTSNAGQTYIENTNSSSKNINHRFNFRFDWDIDSSNSIMIRPRFSLQQNEGQQITSAHTNMFERLLNKSDNDYQSNLLGYDLSNEILWRHKFESKGRTISFSATPGYNENNGNNELYATSYYYTEIETADTLNQNSELVSDGLNLSYNVAYTEPLGEDSQLQFNYSGRLNENKSDKTTNNFNPETDQYDELDTTLSNIFASTYRSQNIGTSYRFQKEETNFSLGLSYQNSRLYNEQQYPYSGITDRSFNNVLPNASYQYRFTKRNNIRIFYRTSTDLPSIEQLQDVVNNNNPLQISIGNPLLEESYTHNLFANYMAVDEENSSNFFFNIGGRFSNNYIGQKTTIMSADTVLSNGYLVQEGVQLTQRVNLDNYYNLRSFIAYGFPVNFISSNMNLNVSFMYTKTPGIYNEQTEIPGVYNEKQNNSFTKTLSLGGVITSNISEKFDFTLMSFSNFNFVSYSLTPDNNTQYFGQRSNFRVNLYLCEFFVLQSELSHQYYSGLSEAYNTNYFQWNAYIGFKMFNKNGELRLSGFDILNQNNSINRNVSDIYIEDTETNVLQRFFMLSFIYTFRNFGLGS